MHKGTKRVDEKEKKNDRDNLHTRKKWFTVEYHRDFYISLVIKDCKRKCNFVLIWSKIGVRKKIIQHFGRRIGREDKFKNETQMGRRQQH